MGALIDLTRAACDAISNGHSEIAKYLLARSQENGFADEVWEAAKVGDLEMAQWLLNKASGVITFPSFPNVCCTTRSVTSGPVASPTLSGQVHGVGDGCCSHEWES